MRIYTFKLFGLLFIPMFDIFILLQDSLQIRLGSAMYAVK